MEIQKYLGKKIEVNLMERGEDMKPTGRLIKIVGRCDSEPQPNPWLNIDLQVVVGRMPVTINSLADIKILPND